MESLPQMDFPPDRIVVGGPRDDIIEPVSPATAAPPATSERWQRLADYASVGILFFINLINYMDRYTVAGVLDKVIGYYTLKNSQGGAAADGVCDNIHDNGTRVWLPG
ncbi:hypothetical protein MRX96_027657 [Rhipicephalus microplus]